jgi:hypothetical protein
MSAVKEFPRIFINRHAGKAPSPLPTIVAHPSGREVAVALRLRRVPPG